MEMTTFQKFMRKVERWKNALRRWRNPEPTEEESKALRAKQLEKHAIARQKRAAVLARGGTDTGWTPSSGGAFGLVVEALSGKRESEFGQSDFGSLGGESIGTLGITYAAPNPLQIIDVEGILGEKK